MTREEFETARARATSYVDQIFAEKQEELEKEFDEKHPGLRDMMSRLLGGLEDDI